MAGCPTDWGVIITAIACLFAILGVTTGLFLYLANKIDALGASLRSEMKSFEIKIESKIDQFKDDVNREMKDFHGRLCSIEERNKPKTNP